jgi:hypothetical protein
MEQLRNRGIDNPEVFASLPTEAIEGAIRWYDSKMRLGQKVGPGLLVSKLKDGGCPGYSEQFRPRAGAFDSHLRWCAKHVPDLSPSIAGGCYDVLRVLLRREPTAAEIRRAVAAREAA